MNIKTIIAKLSPLKDLIVRFKIILFVLFVVGVFGYITLVISYYSNAEPTQDQIENKKLTVKLVKLDEKAIEKIKELQDKNISIESLFNNGRDNPFE